MGIMVKIPYMGIMGYAGFIPSAVVQLRKKLALCSASAV